MRRLLLITATLIAMGLAACSPPAPAPDPQPVWREAFDTRAAGALSAVWGSAPDNVYAVGGNAERGEIYHYDGMAWTAVQLPESVPLLAWVFGFGPDDIHVVGVDGAALRYDGVTWQRFDSGTTEDLWGVWGAAPDDVWIVGGSTGNGDPEIIHFDGADYAAVAVPANDRDASALFKVWGIGDRTFAVGENGLILQLQGDAWNQVPGGPDADDDFVSLWGTATDHIVAVGGRSTARIAVYDGTAWATMKFSGVPGLNAVSMVDPRVAVVGGVNGYVGRFDPTTLELIMESAGTSLTIHGGWADGAGRHYGVGGLFSAPYLGLALVRTVEVVQP